MLFLQFLKEDRLDQFPEFLTIYHEMSPSKNTSPRFYKKFNILIPFYENFD
jgi:hypothetical protein